MPKIRKYKMAAAKKKTVMDISRPGKTSADATTRPLIAGHGAMMKDPMMVDDRKGDDDNQPAVGMESTSDKPKLRPRREMVINPDAAKQDTPSADEEFDTQTPAEPTEEEADQTEQDPASDDQTTASTPVTDEVTEPETPASTEVDEATSDSEPETSDDDVAESSDEQDTNEVPESSSEAVVGAVIDQVSTDQAAKKQAKVDAEQAANLDKLIAAKTYYVPIHSATSASRQGAIIVVLVIILIAVALYTLIATDVIKTTALPF